MRKPKRDKFETNVVFKKFPGGDIIALMPNDSWQDGSGKTLVTSYERIGQHSGASPELLEDLADATPDEYAELKIELEKLGYRLRIDEKLNP